MKKLLPVLVLFMALPAYGLRLGVHGGVNLGSVSTATPAVVTDGKSGILIGAILEHKLATLLSLQLEGNYLKKGYAQSGIGTEFTYFEFPLLLRLNLPLPILTPFLLAGPSLAFLTSANSNGTDIKSQLSSTDFGLMVGAGVELAMGPVASLIFQGRYTMGMTDVSTGSSEVKNKGIQLTGGLLFGF